MGGFLLGFVCLRFLVGWISVVVCFGVFLFVGFLFVFPLLQMPFLGCCKAQAGKTAIQMESGGWPGDAMVLTSNCTFLGKHTTTNSLWIVWIRGVQLGLQAVSPPCYKQSATEPWDRCAWHCAAAQQSMMKNGCMKVFPRLPAGGKSLVCRSCFCFQRGVEEVLGAEIAFLNISGDLLKI